jgi:S-adenosylmethionine hydrolase
MKIITFLSDFGEDDWFVAAVKGEILKIDRALRIIDITHNIRPHDTRSAAFVLRSVYHNFPAGTVHLVIVDPGVGSERRAIMLRSGKYFFVGPDNGVFSYIIAPETEAYAIDIKKETSTTFHGRDIFGPVAARIAAGKSLACLKERIEDLFLFTFPEAVKQADCLYGEVLYVDRFGNLITNIAVESRIESICISGQEIMVKDFYAQGSGQEAICVKGSSGYYEIASFQKRAQELFNAGVGTRITAQLRK